MVQEFFIENALHWVHEYHVDGLRLDATDALHRRGGPPLPRRVRGPGPGRVARGRRVLAHRRGPPQPRHPDPPAGRGRLGLRRRLGRRLPPPGARGSWPATTRGTTATTRGRPRDLAATLNQGWFYTGQHSVNLRRAAGHRPGGPPARAGSSSACRTTTRWATGRSASGCTTRSTRPPTGPPAPCCCAPRRRRCCSWGRSGPRRPRSSTSPTTTRSLGRVVTEGRRKEFRHFKAFADPAARRDDPRPAGPRDVPGEPAGLGRAGPRAARPDPPPLPRAPAAPARRSRPCGPGGSATSRPPRSTTTPSCSGATRTAGRRSGWSSGSAAPGDVDLAGLASPGPGGLGHWEVVLTTEDPPFAPDPSPPEVDLSGAAPVVRFRRPSAVILRSVGGNAR